MGNGATIGAAIVGLGALYLLTRPPGNAVALMDKGGAVIGSNAPPKIFEAPAFNFPAITFPDLTTNLNIATTFQAPTFNPPVSGGDAGVSVAVDPIKAIVTKVTEAVTETPIEVVKEVVAEAVAPFKSIFPATLETLAPPDESTRYNIAASGGVLKQGLDGLKSTVERLTSTLGSIIPLAPPDDFDFMDGAAIVPTRVVEAVKETVETVKDRLNFDTIQEAVQGNNWIGDVGTRFSGAAENIVDNLTPWWWEAGGYVVEGIKLIPEATQWLPPTPGLRPLTEGILDRWFR